MKELKSIADTEDSGKNDNNNLTRNYPIAHPSRLDH